MQGLAAEHQLLTKSDLALANAASFLLLERRYHESLFFLLFLMLLHEETENQGEFGAPSGRTSLAQALAAKLRPALQTTLPMQVRKKLSNVIKINSFYTSKHMKHCRVASPG